MERKKLMLACAVIIIAALAVVATVIFALTRGTDPPSTTPQQVTISGSLACLRHKNVKPGDAVTLECAIGLRTKDQRFYGLQDLPEGASATDFRQEIEVTGELQPPNANERYDVVGIIKVSSLKAK